MIVQIPLVVEPPYEQITTLDGTDYVVTFNTNWRENTINVSLALTDGTVLCSGIKLVCNYPLLQKYPDPRVPNGELFCIALTSDDSPPGPTDLLDGGRCILIYGSKSDFPNLDPWRL